MNLSPRLFRAARFFADPDQCRRILQQARWPGGRPICPVCGGSRSSSITHRKGLRCKDCFHQFSVTVGTLLEDSPLEAGQWLRCIWVLSRSPRIPCRELARLVGVTLRTAWQMRRKIRAAFSLIERPGPFRRLLHEIMQIPKPKIQSVLKHKKKRAL